MKPKLKEMVKFFVEMESKDYTPNKTKEWIDELTKNILKECEDMKQVVLTSCSNMGLTNSQLYIHLDSSRKESKEIVLDTNGSTNPLINPKRIMGLVCFSDD